MANGDIFLHKLTRPVKALLPVVRELAEVIFAEMSHVFLQDRHVGQLVFSQDNALPDQLLRVVNECRSVNVVFAFFKLLGGPVLLTQFEDGPHLLFVVWLAGLLNAKFAASVFVVGLLGLEINFLQSLLKHKLAPLSVLLC